MQLQKNGKKKIGLIMAVLIVLSSVSCVYDHAGGATLEVVYPSGLARDCYTRDETVPIEDTDYQLQVKRAQDGQKRTVYDLEILDGTGAVLYTFPRLGSLAVRGVAEDGSIWISSEQWDTPHYNGYISGGLEETILFQIDQENGDVLFSEKLGGDAFYLMTVGTKCYFYDCGQRGGERGLSRTKERKASIYYRDTEDWEEKVSVHTFDYALQPESSSKDPVEERIRFLLQEDQIIVSVNEYLLTDEETHTWEYVEKESIEIWLDIE